MNDLADTSQANRLFDLVFQQGYQPDISARAAEFGFTVVVTCYNLERFVGESLQSVFSQTWKGPRELIVVDDASIDGSLDVILHTVKNNGVGWPVRIFRARENLGVTKAIECGIVHATYLWIVEVDGDDICFPHRLAKVEETIRRFPNVKFLAQSSAVFRTAAERSHPRPFFSVPDPKNNPFVFLEKSSDRHDALMGLRPWKGTFGNGFSFRRDAILGFGPLAPPDFRRERSIQDVIIQYRAFLSGSVVATAEPVLLYRQHETNLVNNSRNFNPSTSADEVAIKHRKNHVASQSAESLRQCLCDVKVAMCNPCLTDWSQGQLRTLTRQLNSDIAFFSLFSTLQRLPVFVRPFALLLKAPLLGRRIKAFLPQLLPERVYGHLKHRRRLQ